MWMPSNYSKVSGVGSSASWDYFTRGDFIPQIKEYHIYQENQRWWRDYAKNTGISSSAIRYPYRSGFYYQMSGENVWESWKNGGLFISKNIGRLYK